MIIHVTPYSKIPMKVRNEIYSLHKSMNWSTAFKVLDNLLVVSNAIQLSAEKNGELVGCLSIVLYGDTCWVGYVGIRADMRGRGYGKKIIKFAIEYLRKYSSASSIRLITKVNKSYFFKKLGFYEKNKVNHYTANTSFSRPLVNRQNCSQKIANFDKSIFLGNREPRIFEYLMNDGLAVTAYENRNIISGFMFINRLEKGYRVGPIILKEKQATKSFDNMVSSLFENKATVQNDNLNFYIYLVHYLM